MDFKDLPELWLRNNCCLLPHFDFENASQLATRFGIEVHDGLKLLRKIRQSIRDRINGKQDGAL
ncbi:hypothetical protein UR09_00925 [Candidatus Nitromaritima sp. SCGC AAA799-A02]|nr:hypothetical protein UZ36_06870 [Candidatus Nitromaritima sp. SCGC AAA799-C22]KMP12617.1 hypothetical protein UR09_00925 [Candidatus Nitromaritima sp. SCGC AAA799-A02]